MKSRNFLLTVILSLLMLIGLENKAKAQCPCVLNTDCYFGYCIVNTTCDTINMWFTTTCCGDVLINLLPNEPWCGGCMPIVDGCLGSTCIQAIDLHATYGSGGTVSGPALGPWDYPGYGNTLGGYVGWPLGCTQCVGTGINISWDATYPPSGAYVIACDH